MRDYHGCSSCGRKFPEDALTLFAGDYFCEHCLDEETIVCSDCGERLWNDANAGSRTYPLCQRCYDSHYTNCERCGELIDCENAYYLGDGEDYPYCENCYHILKNQVIHNYDYRPETIFYGDGPRYFGVELEIDKGGEIGSNAEQILAVGNRERDFYYCKHDGSLDDGFEIVSHPATTECHLTQLPWKAVMAEAVSLGYRSHQACTCGLHIHISRLAFGRTAAQQEAGSSHRKAALFCGKALERAAEIQPPDKPPVGALGGEIRLQGHAEGNDGSCQELSLWPIYLREPDERRHRGDPYFQRYAQIQHACRNDPVDRSPVRCGDVPER